MEAASYKKTFKFDVRYKSPKKFRISRFGCRFGEPAGSQVGPQAPPKSLKIGISDRQGLQDTPKMPPRPLQDATRTDLGWILDDFGTIFDRKYNKS